MLNVAFTITCSALAHYPVLVAAMRKKAAQPDPQLAAATASAAQPAVAFALL